MFDTKGPLNAVAFRVLAPTGWHYKPHTEVGETVVASPHKVYGPENIDLCTEAHMREPPEPGFEVIVVKDATAADAGRGRWLRRRRNQFRFHGQRGGGDRRRHRRDEGRLENDETWPSSQRDSVRGPQ